MNLIQRCQATLLAGIFLSMIHSASAGPLEPYRAKNRLILASLPTGESRDGFRAALDAYRDGIDERDLKVIDVSRGSARMPHTLRLDAQQTSAIREKLKLTDSETDAVFVLIGKDGGEKARQRGTLNLASWFALIDEMPMRRDEIRRRGKGRE